MNKLDKEKLKILANLVKITLMDYLITKDRKLTVRERRDKIELIFRAKDNIDYLISVEKMFTGIDPKSKTGKMLNSIFEDK